MLPLQCTVVVVLASNRTYVSTLSVCFAFWFCLFERDQHVLTDVWETQGRLVSNHVNRHCTISPLRTCQEIREYTEGKVSLILYLISLSSGCQVMLDHIEDNNPFESLLSSELSHSPSLSVILITSLDFFNQQLNFVQSLIFSEH